MLVPLIKNLCKREMGGEGGGEGGSKRMRERQGGKEERRKGREGRREGREEEGKEGEKRGGREGGREGEKRGGGEGGKGIEWVGHHSAFLYLVSSVLVHLYMCREGRRGGTDIDTWVVVFNMYMCDMCPYIIYYS